MNKIILRSVKTTWIFFLVLTVIKWDLSLCTKEQRVLSTSSLTAKESNPNSRYEFTSESTLEDSQIKRLSVCAACENKEPESYTYASNACEVSDDDLQSLYDLILEAYNKVNPSFRSLRCRKCNRESGVREDSCDGLVDNCRNSSLLPPQPKTNISLDASDDCMDILQEMQDKMRNIIEQLDLLLDSIVDPDRLLEKIAQLQNCVKCLEEKIDVIVKQATQEIAECYEASLGRVTTCFATTLYERTKRIQELETRVTNKTINVIVSNVLASKYVEAAIEYRDLRNESLFDIMMNDLFESRQLERILHFVKALHHNNMTGRAIVYMKLMDMMNYSQPIDINYVIFSSFVTRDRIEFCNGDKFCFNAGLPFEFKTLTEYCKSKVTNVLEKWAILVREKDYRSLLLFGSPEVVNFSGKAFHDIVEDLVSKSYSQDSNFLSNTLDFASALRWNNQSYTAFKTLITQAISQDDTLKIAIKMKEKMDNLNGPDGKDTNRIKFDDLKAHLLDNVRGIAFDEVCTIVYNNENYLFATESFYEGGNRKIGFRMNSSDDDNNFKWRFEKIEKGLNKYEFRIKNVKNGEYLGSHIPWKFVRSRDILATSNPDYLEPPRKFYNWQIQFGGVGVVSDIYFYHVGRMAYLKGNEAALHMDGRKYDALSMWCK